MTGDSASAAWRSAGPEVARTLARQVWDGLGRALTGPAQAPGWRARSAQERQAAYLTLGIATLLLCIINAATVHGVPNAHGQLPAGCLDRLVNGQATIVCSPSRPVGQLSATFAQRVLAVITVAPLLLGARYPMLAWRIGWLALLLSPLAPAAWWGGWPWGPPQIIAVLTAFCLAGLRQQRPVLVWMWALTAIPWLVWLVKDVPNIKGPVSATIVFAVVGVAVDSVGARLLTQRALTDQAAQTEAERDRRAVLEERARIARELHDVVAHHMSLVAVRAETAPYRLADLPDAVRSEFVSLSEVAREAMADMRRLLGILRDDQPAALAPQPRLADVPALVDSARQAGVSVDLWVAGTMDQVPSALGVCAYRIVQESLSNASQHAPGAPVAVTVSIDPGTASLVLQVSNGPADATNAASATAASEQAGDHIRAGHGLVGMRERVALLGGSLSAGPAPGGRFVVSAVLPFGDPA